MNAPIILANPTSSPSPTATARPCAVAGNLLAPVARGLPAEVVETLVDATSVRIERVVSDGHRSAPDFWYDQDCREWVVLLAGAAVLEFADRSVCLTPGMHVDIAAHERHRIVSTSQTMQAVWLAVFYQLPP
jgi:cupin 2 domain-containing protein